jgi:hypothetical protein
MFPPKSAYSRYEERAQRKFPSRGDVSIRSALTIHRGTAHASQKPRPVLVLGVDAPGAINAERHDLAVTRNFGDTIPDSLRAHLGCPIVDELRPITQKHTIEGLVMARPDQSFVRRLPSAVHHPPLAAGQIAELAGCRG